MKNNKTEGKTNCIIIGNRSYSVSNSARQSPAKYIKKKINNLPTYTVFKSGLKNKSKVSTINSKLNTETQRLNNNNRNFANTRYIKNFTFYTEKSSPTNMKAYSSRENLADKGLVPSPYMKSKPNAQINLTNSIKSLYDKSILKSTSNRERKTRNERSDLTAIMDGSSIKFSNNPLFNQSRNKLYINMEKQNESVIGRKIKLFNSTSKVVKTEEKSINNGSKRSRSNDSKRVDNKYGNHLYVSILSSKFKKYDNAKYGAKSNGCIIGYGVNTNKGTVRNYNEDRVSIILNVVKPSSRKHEEWPKVSFFGIYDGHGGNKCADFLKENLHQFIFSEKLFPDDPAKAIMKGFEEAEKKFILENKPVNLINEFNRSGSCAIVVVILDDYCYIANLGDSRGLISENGGEKVFLLSKDHKPNDPDEKKRIYSAGGYIYQGINQNPNGSFNNININLNIKPIDSPWRIMPGKLSVSRAFGDLEAKIPELGGNSKVLIASPHIVSFKINEMTDFIVLGSDGIFDKLTNHEIIKCIWSTTSKELIADNIHKHCGRVADLVMKNSLYNNSYDNITCLFICFENFKNILYGSSNENLSEKIVEKLNSSSSDNYSLKLDENLNFINKYKNIEKYSGGSQLKTQNNSYDSEDENYLNENDDDSSDIYNIIKNNKNKKRNIGLKSYQNFSHFGSTMSSKLSKFDNLSKDIKSPEQKLINYKEKSLLNLNTSNSNKNIGNPGKGNNKSIFNYNAITNKGLYLTSKNKK